MHETMLISIVMANFNTPMPYLVKAVNSILTQSYESFEFIIIDDCSTDLSFNYLSNLKDARIRLYRNTTNLGITESLKIGFSLSTCKYIARMDSDDISYHYRLEKQLNFMEQNTDVIVCGTWAQAFGDQEYCINRITPDHETLRCSMLFGNRFGLVHPTAFFRRDLLVQNNINYDSKLITAQDYGMWVKCLKYGKIACLNEVLLKYRIHNNQISLKKREIQESCAEKVQYDQLVSLIGDKFDVLDIKKHRQASNLKHIDRDDIIWFKYLQQCNLKSNQFDNKTLVRYSKSYIFDKAYNYAKTSKDVKLIFTQLFKLPFYAKFAILKAVFVRILDRF